MQPVAKFVKSINGLSVQFTDSSLGVPTNWEWNFGDGDTSTLKNPTHTYTTAGTYYVVLTAYNGDGYDTIVSQILVGSNGLNQTIAEMVLCETPAGIWVDTECFLNLQKKWMLFLQPLTTPEIELASVFDEAAWPDLPKVLLAKLIIYEHIQRVIKNSILELSPKATEFYQPNFLQVADYVASNITPASFNSPATFSVGIVINGHTYSSGALATGIAGFVSYLNGLGKGVFSYDETLETLSSYANPYNVTEITVGSTLASLVVENFVKTNSQIIPATPQSVVDDIPKTAMGAIKYLETGPSRVEWYDRSEMWANMFQKNGAMDELKNELCGLASRLRIKLPMCKLSTTTPLFVKASNPKCDKPNVSGLYINNI